MSLKRRIFLTLVFAFIWIYGAHGQCQNRTALVLPANETVQTFQSPNYPQKYPRHAYCQWLIRAPSINYTVRMTTKHLDIEHFDPGCNFDRITVFNGADKDTAYARRFCLGNVTVTTTEPDLLVLFESNGNREGTGFQFGYRAVWSPRPVTTPKPVTEAPKERREEGGVDKWVVIGGVAGGLAFLVIVALICCRRCGGSREPRRPPSHHAAGFYNSHGLPTSPLQGGPGAVGGGDNAGSVSTTVHMLQSSNTVFMVSQAMGPNGSPTPHVLTDLRNGVANMGFEDGGDPPGVGVGGVGMMGPPVGVPPPSYIESMMQTNPPIVPPTPRHTPGRPALPVYIHNTGLAPPPLYAPRGEVGAESVPAPGVSAGETAGLQQQSGQQASGTEGDAAQCSTAAAGGVGVAGVPGRAAAVLPPLAEVDTPPGEEEAPAGGCAGVVGVSAQPAVAVVDRLAQSAAEAPEPCTGESSALPCVAGTSEQPEEGSSAQPIAVGSSQQPADDGSSQQPADDGSSQQPEHDGTSEQPEDHGTSKQPEDDGTSVQPAGDGTSQQPAGDGTSEQPADDGTSEQPADDGTSEQPAGDGTSEQPADDGTSQQPATDGTSQQPAGDGTSELPAGDGTSEQPEGGGTSEQPSNDGTSEQPAGDGTSVQPAGDGMSEQPSNDGTSQQPSNDRTSEQPAGDGTSEQPIAGQGSEQSLQQETPEEVSTVRTCPQPTPEATPEHRSMESGDTGNSIHDHSQTSATSSPNPAEIKSLGSPPHTPNSPASEPQTEDDTGSSTMQAAAEQTTEVTQPCSAEEQNSSVDSQRAETQSTETPPTNPRSRETALETSDEASAGSLAALAGEQTGPEDNVETVPAKETSPQPQPEPSERRQVPDTETVKPSQDDDQEQGSETPDCIHTATGENLQSAPASSESVTSVEHSDNTTAPHSSDADPVAHPQSENGEAEETVPETSSSPEDRVLPDKAPNPQVSDIQGHDNVERSASGSILPPPAALYTCESQDSDPGSFPAPPPPLTAD